MKCRLLRWVLTGVCLAIGPAAFAQLLKPGSQAPEVRAGAWLKGEAFQSYSKHELTVIEFWGTKCGPCIDQMPHLTAMAKKYAGRVGIYGFARKEGDGEGEERGATAKFVAEMGGKMDYNVALDTDDGFMRRAWMAASEIEAIPTIYLVDRGGKILLIDWDSAGVEKAIDQVLAGAFNLEASISKFDTERLTGARNRALDEEIRSARTLYEEGKRDQALQTLGSIDVGDFKPDSGLRRLWSLIKLQILLDEPERASAYVDELIADAIPASTRALSQIGFYTSVATNADAKRVVTRAMEAAQKLDPKNPAIYYETGTGWLMMGDRKRAKADLATGEKLIKENLDLFGRLQSLFDNLRQWIADHEAFPCRL